MSNAIAAVTYSLASNWAPSGSKIVPYVDENQVQPTITNPAGTWLSLTQPVPNQPKAVQVQRPSGVDPSVGLDLQITVVDPNPVSPATLTPLGIVIRKYPGRGGTFDGASISGTVITLTDLDNAAGQYHFYVLFTDGQNNYGLLDPRLINQS